jgi:hypothetical protein
MKLRLAHRIIDQAKNNRDFPGYGRLDQKQVEMSINMIQAEGCAHIIADNVQDYIFKQCDEDGGVRLDGSKVFSNLAPPFEAFFIEATRRNHIKQIGWLVVPVERDLARDHDFAKVYFEDDWKWVLIMKVFVCLPDGEAAMMDDVAYIFVSETGEFVASDHWDGYLGKIFKEGTDNFYNIFSIPMMVINFMNCRNVQLDDVTPTVGPSRKWLRRRKQRKLTYRIVTIDPDKPQVKRSSKRQEGISTQPRSHHIRRGHFVTYTDDGTNKGLFGRGIYGTFWKPSHEVGDKKNGKTVTTYHVKAPK